MPPVGGFGAEDEGEHSEAGGSAEHGGEVGAHAHRLEQLGHSGTLACAYGEDAQHRKDYAYCRDEHRGRDGAELHFRTEGKESGGAEGHSRKYGTAIGFIEVGTHSCDVTHVVTHVVGDGGRIARVVLREICLDLSHEVGTHVGRLGVDSAAHAGEESLGGCTHAEGEHGGSDDHELLGFRGFYDKMIENNVPERNVKQAKAHDGETHYGTGTESDLKAGVEGLARGGSCPAGGEGGGLHSYETGQPGEESSGKEGKWNPAVLDMENIGKHCEEHSKHHEDNAYDLVLLFEIGHCAFAHELRYLTHCRSSFILFFHLGIENACETQSDD